MARELPYVGPPEGGRVFRVSRGFDVFAPQDWSWAQEDGTFGNRFDDPGKYRGMPEEDRFRMVYCATQRAGAFGETIARFRRSPRLGEGLRTVDDEEPFAPKRYLTSTFRRYIESGRCQAVLQPHRGAKIYLGFLETKMPKMLPAALIRRASRN